MEVNARFSKGGDSGSVYYAVKGSFRYPVGIHRGTVLHTYTTQLGESKQTISIGTPIHQYLSDAKEHFSDMLGLEDSWEWVFNDAAELS